MGVENLPCLRRAPLSPAMEGGFEGGSDGGREGGGGGSAASEGREMAVGPELRHRSSSENLAAYDGPRKAGSKQGEQYPLDFKWTVHRLESFLFAGD